MVEQAGFYRELGGARGGTAVPSLRDAARDVGEWDEERLIAYLEASHEIYTTMGAERDVIADDVWITGAGSLTTDGTYVWPTELAYYVRRHHVPLLPEFAAHIRARAYVSPEVPRERALAIFEECLGAGEGALPADEATPGGPLTWYRTPFTRTSAQDLIDRLSAAGLYVHHPLAEHLFGFRDTARGRREPLVGGVDTLVSTLAGDEYRNVEFRGWLGRDEPLTVTARRLSADTQQLTFHIGDLPEPAREQAVSALLRALDQGSPGDSTSPSPTAGLRETSRRLP